jgi:hypothetical protein
MRRGVRFGGSADEVGKFLTIWTVQGGPKILVSAIGVMSSAESGREAGELCTIAESCPLWQQR